ncbi:AAA family ATPase [Burkholderia contaminans]|uniref:AAA family ATPase n=2 Tax=Burkholderia contaminans TaxID=488447 RepID=UPI002D80BF80|nr:AAA family ATPase [Burkholderia contaminans]
MTIEFKIVSRGERSLTPGKNVVHLVVDSWDDFSYKTLFEVIVGDQNGRRIEIGSIKIGYAGQGYGWTKDALTNPFKALPLNWFSLGQDVEYYINLRDNLNSEFLKEFLLSIGDVVNSKDRMDLALGQDVFKTSLMRGVSLSVIHGQFQRVLNGDVALTEFRFVYRDVGDEKRAPVNLSFHVVPGSKPSTNVHVLIGRNGVGKTTLLNNMVSAIISPSKDDSSRGRFNEIGMWGGESSLSADYFSSVVSVSFSAFDPFVPPVDQPDRSKGVVYFYVGMKKSRSDSNGKVTFEPPKSEVDLANDLVDSLESCLGQPAKRDRWRAAISRLESDKNFADMALGRLLEMERDQAISLARSLVGRMSSGHSIVLLTITKLVDTVEEKTLVLMDEPESHLHPPLLAAFTRALSDLLNNRNGVAIIATHSPVVTQEVPRVCVWKLTRSRADGRADRPDRETFGENVGVLTREIFGLEVAKSGFHEVLASAVADGGTFESIIEQYSGQLGFEAQAIVRALVVARDMNQVPPYLK